MAPGQFGPEAPRKRTGDRITTAILLAVGAIANFFFAQMFFALEPTFAQLFEMYGLGELTAPAAIGALSTVGAITMLSLWALALVGSLLLIRAGKPSWYVPVIAAVLSVIALFIILGLATQSVPRAVHRNSGDGRHSALCGPVTRGSCGGIAPRFLRRIRSSRA